MINKATPTATLAVTNSPVVYDGLPHAAEVGITVSSVPGSVSNILTGGAATQTNVGTYAVTADFVPTDTANYNTVTGLSAGNFVIESALTYNLTRQQDGHGFGHGDECAGRASPAAPPARTPSTTTRVSR